MHVIVGTVDALLVVIKCDAFFFLHNLRVKAPRPSELHMVKIRAVKIK
jgi:hypothetical protein